MQRKAVFFDLDGTLFHMEQEKFLARYFGLLGQYAVRHGLSEQTPKIIFQAAMRMVDSPVAGMNNGENFYRLFAEMSGVSPEVFVPIFNVFYQTDYDTLSSDVESHPGALEAVRIAKEKGYLLVVATNPVFPYIAVEKRLRWAGLSPDDFTLITHMDNCHFAKPDLRYYQEILDTLQLQPQQCLMVGNDAEEDICALSLGIDAFYLTELPICRGEAPTCPQGGFAELLAYLRR